MKTLRTLVPSLFALSLVALVTSCGFKVQEREVLIRHDEEADTLDVLFLYKVVSLPDMNTNDLRDAERILDGARAFGLDWPLYCDLEEIDRSGLDEADAALLDGVRVAEVGAYLDGQGRLSCYQHLTAENASAIVARLNELISLELRDSGPDDGDEFPATYALWMEAAGRREPWEWLRLEGPRLIVNVPVAEREAPKILESLVGDRQGLELLRTMSEALERITLVEDRLTLTFGDGEGPIALRFRRPDAAYDSRLLEELRSTGAVIPREIHVDSLRERFVRGK